MSQSQHIDNFNIAIKSLDVRVKEKFVTAEGYVRPIYLPDRKQEEADRFGYHISTFYDLDHYNYYREEDNYDKSLGQLRILAMNEIRLLPTDDLIKRQLRHFERLRDRFIELSTLTAKFYQDFAHGIADTTLFMELKIYPAFEVVNMPTASMDEEFAENLKYAIRTKRGHLVAIVKEIKRELGIEEALLTDAAHETPIDVTQEVKRLGKPRGPYGKPAEERRALIEYYFKLIKEDNFSSEIAQAKAIKDCQSSDSTFRKAMLEYHEKPK